MLTFSIIKMFLGRMIEFIANHYKEIILVLILCIAYYYKTRYEATVQELALFHRDIATLTAKTMAENEKKLIIAQNSVNAATVKAQHDMQRLNLDRERETKNLKGLYENRIDSTKFNFTERLRLEAERHRLGLPETASDTSTLAESWRECHTAYSTIEQACQITTIDYNELRGWADAACLQVGCE